VRYMYTKVATHGRMLFEKNRCALQNRPHLQLSIAEPATAATVTAEVAARGRGALAWTSALVARSLTGGAGETRAAESTESASGITGLSRSSRAGSRDGGGVGRCLGLGGSRCLGCGGDRRARVAAAAAAVVLGSHGGDGELGECPGLSAVRGEHVGVGSTVGGTEGVDEGLIGGLEDDGRVDPGLLGDGSRALAAIVVVALDSGAPAQHGTRSLVEGRQQITGDSIAHGPFSLSVYILASLVLSGYLLQPEVALLVDEGVVEEDTVLVVHVSSCQLSDPLVGNTGISVSVDLGRDTPLSESQSQIPPILMCMEIAYQVLSASAPLHSLWPAGYDPMTLWIRSPVPLEIPSQRYSRPSWPEGIFPG
jgi:hypothetical protein